MVKFPNFEDRESILEKYSKMKLRREYLFINEDFSEKTTCIQKQLSQQAKELRSTGKAKEQRSTGK